MASKDLLLWNSFQITVLFRWLRRNNCFGRTRWGTKAPNTFSRWWTPFGFSILFGEWLATSWATRSSSLVSARQRFVFVSIVSPRNQCFKFRAQQCMYSYNHLYSLYSSTKQKYKNKHSVEAKFLKTVSQPYKIKSA